MILNTEILHLPEDTPVLLDGDHGEVYVDPPETILRRYNEEKQDIAHLERDDPLLHTRPAQTADGRNIRLLANINLLSELPLAGDIGAEGVGLYRTEFPFLVRPSFPSETEQYVVYRKVAKAMGDKPVNFRTLDIGGEKAVAYGNTVEEANPELGLRSIRFALEYKDVFEQQVRAILRAAKGL